MGQERRVGRGAAAGAGPDAAKGGGIFFAFTQKTGMLIIVIPIIEPGSPDRDSSFEFDGVPGKIPAD